MTDLFDMGVHVLCQQPFSRLLGAELTRLVPGEATLSMVVGADHLQQYGFAHGGVIAYLADNAITFAAGSMAGADVLTSEFKINYLKPAKPGRLVAVATVEGQSTRQMVCRCDLAWVSGDKVMERIAIAQGTVSINPRATR